MIRNFLPAILSASAIALVAAPIAAQTTTPTVVTAELAGRGANGDFTGTITGDQMCYRLTTSGLPGATNPRISGNDGARTVQLLPISSNTSEGCVRVGNQNARLIARNPRNFHVYVDAGSGSSGLEGQLR